MGEPTTEEVRAIVSLMLLSVSFHQETDGRWLADVAELPGVMAYGATQREALTAVEVLALRVIADQIEHGELTPGALAVSFQLPAAA